MVHWNPTKTVPQPRLVGEARVGWRSRCERLSQRRQPALKRGSMDRITLERELFILAFLTLGSETWRATAGALTLQQLAAHGRERRRCRFLPVCSSMHLYRRPLILLGRGRNSFCQIESAAKSNHGTTTNFEERQRHYDSCVTRWPGEWVELQCASTRRDSGTGLA